MWPGDEVNANMLTFAFMHYPYLVCTLFGMPSLHLFTFLMFFKSCVHYNAYGVD